MGPFDDLSEVNDDRGGQGPQSEDMEELSQTRDIETLGIARLSKQDARMPEVRKPGLGGISFLG